MIDSACPPAEIERTITRLVTDKTSAMPWHPGYDSWVQSRIWQEHARESLVQTLRHFVPRLDDKRVLDLGCGMGGLLVRLRRDGVRTLGVEYNFDNCTITRLRGARYGAPPPVLNGCAESLSLKDASVDVVLCYEVIEHVQDPAAMLRECRRVLAPGGYVFVTVPNRWSLYDHHYHLWGIGLLPRPLADRLITRIGRAKQSRAAGVQTLSEMHYYSWRRFTRQCRRLGFDVIDVVEQRLARRAERTVSDDNVYRFLLPVVEPLRRLGLLRGAYRLFRWTVMDAYHVVLRPRSA